MTNEEAARAIAQRYKDALIQAIEELIEERLHNFLLVIFDEIFKEENNTEKSTHNNN